jgi:hypothetical protein
LQDNGSIFGRLLFESLEVVVECVIISEEDTRVDLGIMMSNGRDISSDQDDSPPPWVCGKKLAEWYQ